MLLSIHMFILCAGGGVAEQNPGQHAVHHQT